MESQPISSMNSISQYGDDTDSVRRWRQARVEKSKTHMTSASDLYNDYVAYEPGTPVSITTFGRILGQTDTRIRNSRGIYYALVEKKEQDQ